MSDQKAKMALLLEAETDFGLNLLRQQSISNASLVFSPLSIALALSLVHVAAKGETKDQIRNVIAKGATDEELEQHFSNITKALLSAEKGTQVNVANHIFARDGFTIKQQYLDTVQKLYNADATSHNFTDQQATAEAINSFVKNHTGNHIKEIIKPEAISDDLVSVLINALYFKADWSQKFKKSNTLEQDFFSNENDKRKIEFLRAPSAHKNYAENENWQVVQLPYKDESYSFLVFLPTTRFGLQNALKTLDAKTIQHLISNVSNEFVTVEIPKINIETSIGLKPTLEHLGIKHAFEASADLSNFADGIYVSQVTHKAKIEVDEDGTTAAAATSIEFSLKSAMMHINEPKIFRADHPFLFVLAKDNHPLFVGVHN